MTNSANKRSVGAHIVENESLFTTSRTGRDPLAD
jgi:hypothetical protein